MRRIRSHWTCAHSIRLRRGERGREGGGSGGGVRERVVAMAGRRCVGEGDSLSISERDLVEAP